MFLTAAVLLALAQVSPDDQAGTEAPPPTTDPFDRLSSEEIELREKVGIPYRPVSPLFELSKEGADPAVVEAPPEPLVSVDSAATERAAVARRRSELNAELAAVQEKLPKKALPIALIAVGGATCTSSLLGLLIAQAQYRGPNMAKVTDGCGFTLGCGMHLEPLRPGLAGDWIGPIVGGAAAAAGLAWLIVVAVQRRHLLAPINKALDLLDAEEEAADALRLTAPPPSSRLPAVPMQLQLPVARF